MKVRVVSVIVLALVLSLVFTSVASATSQATIEKIIKDANDGVIDGTYSTADIKAALEWAKNNPDISMYSIVEGVLEDYLASLQAPGAQAGELKFTGSELLLLFGAATGLIGSGLVLRRRRP